MYKISNKKAQIEQIVFDLGINFVNGSFES